jgi:CheY-like chemotaxis protein
MLAPEELQRLRAALAELDKLLAGLADFGGMPGLLMHDDPQVQNLIERTVVNVGTARLLVTEMVAALEPQRGEERSGESSSGPVLAGQNDDHPAPPNASPGTAEAPLKVAPPANLAQITMANPTGMREVILIADHDPDALAEIEKLLTDEDFRVLTVRDGFEAISIYARLWAAIDLVILDFSLPGMSGDLVFDELQAINPRVAAVVSSGFTHPDKLKQMLGQGLSGFLPKPYERERLIHQINQVLAHRPAIGR